GSSQDLTHRIQPSVETWRRRRPAVPAAAWQRRRHAVVAVHAADLLDQVLRNRDVEPEHRRQDVPLAVGHHLDVEVQPLEDTLGPLKFAASSRTSTVAPVTAVSSPPMTPAMATGRSASAITSMSGVSRLSSPSRQSSFSFAFARLTWMAGPLSLARSKACSGCAYSSST